MTEISICEGVNFNPLKMTVFTFLTLPILLLTETYFAVEVLRAINTSLCCFEQPNPDKILVIKY